MGSGRSSGIACALATGMGVILTSLTSLFCAALILNQIPIIYKSLTIIGGVLLLYFSMKYMQKAFLYNEELKVQRGVKNVVAFRQAFLVLISNPKMLTTWLAVISLFPITTSNLNYIIVFSLMAGIASFAGHLLFATIFSTVLVSRIYMIIYRPINAFVGVCFIIYAIKLFLNILY